MKKKFTNYIKLALFIFAVLWSNYTFAQKPAGMNQRDYEVLMELYQDTNGNNWLDNQNWGTPILPWYGVVLNNDGKVKILHLTENNLIGSLPSDLNDLEDLMVLNLSKNKLYGSLPSMNGTFNSPVDTTDIHESQKNEIFREYANKNLFLVIDIHDNSFSGNIPNLDNLSYLRYIDLKKNNFSGDTPDLSTNSSLLYFNCSDNRLDGSLRSLSSSLNYFSCANNFLTGGIDLTGAEDLATFDASNNEFNLEFYGISNLTSLSSIDISSNSLSGNIPEIKHLLSLRHFKADNNNFIGDTPDIKGHLALNYLNVSQNNLNGKIRELDGAINLQEYIANDNELSDKIPSLKNLTSLHKLKLENNDLDGEIPSMESLLNLKYLDISNNDITGTLPDFSQSTLLEYFNCASNEIKGYFPTFLNQLDRIESFYCQDNSLMGSVYGIENITSFNCQYNLFQPYDFTSTIFGIGHNYSISPQKEINLEFNSSSGIVSSPQIKRRAVQEYAWYVDGQLYIKSTNSRLKLDQQDWGREIYLVISTPDFPELKVYSDRITPGKPANMDLYDFKVLLSIYESCDGPNWKNNTNWITSNPDWYGVTLDDRGRVVSLILNNNGLKNRLPNIDELDVLDVLSLASNHLIGIIPPLSTLEILEVLDLSDNKFEGVLPDLSGLDYLKKIDVNDNKLTGDIIPLEDHGYLEHAYFANNNFEGNIPKFNSQLKSLDVTGNKLTGEVPELPESSQIENILIAKNKISGSIPDIISLSSLKTLDCSDNKLTGELPLNLFYHKSLVRFNCSKNSLTGNVPLFDSNENFKYINISENKLNGSLVTLSQSDSLTEFHAYKNEIGSDFPELNNLEKLSILNVSDNLISGEIANLDIVNIKMLVISNNLIKGNLPDLSRMQHLEVLNVENNKLNGHLSSISNNHHLEYFNCSKNELIGQIPQPSESGKLKTLLCNENHLSGEIPNLSTLEKLECSKNKFQPSDFEESNVTAIYDIKISPQQDVRIEPNMSSSRIRIEDLRPSPSQNYQWYRNEKLIPGAVKRTYQTNPDDYGHFFYVTLESIKAPGLTVYSDTILYSLLAIKDDALPENVTISPNPSSDYLKVQLDKKSIKKLMVTDYTGKILFTKNNSMSNSELINISNLETGTYIIRIIDSGGQHHSRKLIKK
ncbi:T9SS type A sorting domain-containing protein [Aureibacter tunicatorum]|uniref:Leucine-rich repeat (LRR) protein n=1 Tax=Aureibacter tunicatorum TaxID=866807 RepID=A0AAE4BQX5_9BACT|nr:T9SS type A sorting domain-containing protein [Aureibacter tunicatorum]MDR6239634.1 Leucine-rich repeat (LRR) protein [Aureibacter tunicatorum]BDD04110.1 hypothetical protein AUTU_15930 [Aureibacter tunicatorum]